MSESDGFFTENVMKLVLDKMWKVWYNIYACHRRVSQTNYREVSLAPHNKKPGALRNFGLFIN